MNHAFPLNFGLSTSLTSATSEILLPSTTNVYFLHLSLTRISWDPVLFLNTYIEWPIAERSAEAMASRAQLDNAPLTTDDLPSLGNSASIIDLPKCDEYDSSTQFTPTDVGTPVADEAGSTTFAAGRKRKVNNASARGVANLSAEQLAKKRANDRQAQRAIRERTKTHIEGLERQVRDLSSQKPFLDLQTALRQNEAIQAENRELRQGLKRAMDILQPLLAKEGSSGPATGPDTHSKPGPSALSPENHRFTTTPSSHPSGTADLGTESISSVGTPSSVHSAPTVGGRRDSTSSIPSSASFRIAVDYQRHNLAHGLDLGPEERLGFNFLVNGAQQFPKVEPIREASDRDLRASFNSTPSPAFDQSSPAFSAPIRNVPATCALDVILLDFLHNRQREAAQGVPKQRLVGPAYPSVSSLLNPEKSAYSHPISKVFTDILRTFPDISSLPEQVAVLYMMFILMRWQIYSTPENYDRLPEWLTPRPSQLLTPHPAWIDYLPWPRMRDRLVMSYHDYPFENWFIPFTRTLSVNWPYEATDCLLSTGDSEELIINPVFERHFRNLANWSLGKAFAESFPGLVETTTIKS